MPVNQIEQSIKPIQQMTLQFLIDGKKQVGDSSGTGVSLVIQMIITL